MADADGNSELCPLRMSESGELMRQDLVFNDAVVRFLTNQLGEGEGGFGVERSCHVVGVGGEETRRQRRLGG